MRVTLVAVCAISALISTVSTLRCRVCDSVIYDVGQADCKNTYKYCPDEMVCASVFVSTTNYDQTNELYLSRKCLEPQYCNKSGSFTTPAFNILYSSRCCDTDNCTPAVAVLPAENNTKNGVLCPACYSFEVNNCQAKYAMECTGQEKYCLDYQRQTLYDMPPISSMGCATKDICSHKEALPIFKHERNTDVISCTEISSKHELKARNFIWCYTCQNSNINNCDDQNYLCEHDEDICMFERTRIIYDGRDDTEITKRCGKSIECRRSGIIRSLNKTILMNTTCCNKTLCNAPLPTLPPISAEDNGLICPSCFIPNSDRCLGRSSLKCTGNENRCIHYMRTDIQDVYAMTEDLHGCTTNDICEVGSSIIYSYLNKNKRIKTYIMCNGSISWRATGSVMDVIIPIISILQMYI